jgi:murein DD-endopeptidase MepM/ murein hydrolase activator NlpD
MKNLNFIFVATLFFIINNTKAQSFFAPKKYPSSQFSNPMEFPISLAGNFGECRPNHFHSGLDVRTKQIENLPVHSIGDGYIARIKIEAGGFGNAIYINHPGGYTSLYAHLNKFYPELEAYIRAKQYEQKTWKIDVTLLPHQFPLMKGKMIAYSGNTGSSQAPHLHLEIRDTKTEKPLNGLLFLKMQDTKAPLLKKLALYDANQSIYDQSPKQFVCVKKGDHYIPTTDTLVVNTNVLGMGIVADDPMEGALGVLGVYEVNTYINNKPDFGWQLDNIGYEETRYMNALADYKTKKNGGAWIQLLYKMTGDNLKIYKSYNPNLNGRIYFEDERPKQIKIIVKDVAGNTSSLLFWVRSKQAQRQKEFYKLEAGKENTYDDGNIAFKMPANCLYDGVPLIAKIISGTDFGNTQYVVHTSDVPVHDYFELKLKPQATVPANLKTKIAFVRQPYGHDKDKKGKAATMQNGWAVCAVRDFGTYGLVLDETPPALTGGPAAGAVLVGNKIVFKAKDETTSIQSFVGKIDNQWVRFAQKGDYFTYELDNYCGVGTHVLEIIVSDENGNVTKKTINFTK